MVILLGVGHAEVDGDLIEKRRVGQGGALGGEILAHLEHQFVSARLQVVALKQRSFAAPVGIGKHLRQKLLFGAPDGVKPYAYPVCRRAVQGVEYMRGKLSHSVSGCLLELPGFYRKRESGRKPDCQQFMLTILFYMPIIVNSGLPIFFDGVNMLCLDQHAERDSEIAAPRASSLLEGGLGGGEADRVYADIFDAVMDRRLLPGAKLTEATLCEVFACSRATVRAALAQLAHDKIVVLRPNRGAFVWRPSQAEMRDVFELRRDIECLLIDKLVALPDLARHLQPLRDMVRQEHQAFECGDRISWLRLSNAFHVKLAQLAGNEVLTELMHSLCSRTTLIIAYRDTPAASTCSYIEHERILDLLAAADRAGAREAMSHHLSDCEERMLEVSSGRTDPWAAFSVKPEEQP